MPRVVLVGAESTGKTTLAAELADRFAAAWVPEYGREHWERKVAGGWAGPVAPAWSADEFVHIAAEQQRREWAAARGDGRLLVCDTNATATGTWFERYLGRRDDRVDAIGRADRVALYLLPDPDVPFVQDGFRDGEAIRGWMHGRFAERLAAGPAPVVHLSGGWDRRRATAVAAVADLIATGRGNA